MSPRMELQDTAGQATNLFKATGMCAVDTWDDVDAEMHECQVLSDMVWDLASEIGYDGPPAKDALDRLLVLSSVTASKIGQLKEALRKCRMRERPSVMTSRS